MSNDNITLPNGDTVIKPRDDRSLTIYIGDVYKYRLVDSSEAIITSGGKYVPRVNDIVYHFQLGFFRVSSIDNTTLVANLSEWSYEVSDPEVTEEDKFLSTGTGYQSESWRVYLDTRTLPYRLEVDEGFRIYGSKSTSIRIFRGVDTTESGEIISAYYNQNNEYVSDSIPLEVVADVTDSVFSPTAEISNISIRAPKLGYTTKDLTEGEYVTLVSYSQDGIPQRTARMIVHKTNVYKRVEDKQKRVTSIQLLSSYLSEIDVNTLLVPLNINVASLTLEARVNYSDGTYKIMAVGDETSDSKFKLFGLKYWSPTISGTPQRLSLVYRLSPSEEYSRAMGETEDGVIKENYIIQATKVDPSMSLKLFAFPSWVSHINEYELKYWLFDLKRLTFYRVPITAIELDRNSRSFEGSNLSDLQTLTVAVKLGDLDTLWGTHRHVQTFQVGLVRAGGLRATNWRVKHSNNQFDWYGDNKEALSSVGPGQNRIFDITCGYGSLEEWLDAIFYSQEPLYNPEAESKAPEPTHIVLVTNSREFDFPISMWNKELTINSDLLEGQLLGIRFIRRDVNGELQLGMSGLPMHNV